MSETATACTTVVVGADGSESSLRAVAGKVRTAQRDVLVVHATG